MPKKRQIPRLFEQRLSDGTTVYHWKPSKTLRDAGWINVKLGTDEDAAIDGARQLNKQVDAVQTGKPGEGAPVAPAPRPAPRVLRFGDLVRLYRASPDYTELRQSTRHEYDTRLRQLEHWAMDGQTIVRAIDVDLVQDLRDELLKHRGPFIAASTIRVLRLLLNWARPRHIKDNPADYVSVSDPPSRKTRMPRLARAAIKEAADALAMPDVVLGIDLGQWTLQRQADLLTLNRFGWRAMDNLDIEPHVAARLADPRGRIMGFRLQQQKTGVWIDAPIPPFLHDRVREAMGGRAGDFVFKHKDRPNEAMPGWMFQRRFREAQDAAVAVAIMEDDLALAEAIDACQFRDLRRTGMIFYKDAGAKPADITALSGHYVLGKKTILDTYMPGDPEGACRCVAAGIASEAERAKRERVG